ncbi:hypothetical protein [Streptomyces sp. t39]|uniref:hypothetical protein n=1 Tax=Streptomyces sp. t39 TaxID=1828156 RepID=UPI0011CECB55|nr:hypothetical protein [Streptomyces sp. t39]
METVDNPPAALRADGGRGTDGACSGGPADGSGPTLSARAWAVLAPVRHLLGPDTTRWEITRIEREILAQLAAGTGMQRLTDRLTRRYACTTPVRDGGRWILGAGLPRRGCGLDACEDGVIWHSGAPCGVCLDLALTSPPGEQQAPAAAEEQPPVAASAAAPLPAPALPPGPVPPELTREQLAALRAAAGPGTIRAAVAQYGRARATYLYGWRAVAALDDAGGPDAQ